MPANRPQRGGRAPEPAAGSSARDAFRVHALVRGSDGHPLPGLIVRAFDKDLRTEPLLAENTTMPAY
jgi:hypothetical protein